MNSKKTAVIITLVGIFIVLPVVLLSKNSHDQTSKKVSPEGSTTNKKDVPDASVIGMVGQYINAREDSIGADQPTPTSWLASVQSITTTAWFAKLQPDPNSATSTTSAQYYVAHDNHYIVQAKLSGCIWSVEGGTRSVDSGNIYCSLSDKTIDQSSGLEIHGTSLPFGWSHSGKQTPVLLKLVKQNGAWLVDGDESGQG